ncbi:MAG: hypothetical protein AAFW69_07030 [Pseudomonadota bacterium]
MGRGTILAAVLAAGLTGGAAAQDNTVDWTGYSAGVHAGGLLGDFFGEFDSAGDTLFYGDSEGPQPLVGIQLEYHHQFKNNIVLGATVDLAFSFLDNEGPISSESDQLFTEIDYFASAGIRAGYAMGRFLPYATGGIAFANYDGRAFDFASGVTAEIGEGNAGQFFGGGIKYRYSERVSFFAEGLYFPFDDENETETVTPDSDPGDRFGLAGITVFRLGASFHF